METRQQLQPLNASYIVLIPKKESATKLADYRPISLIHGIQKIFSKVLANRLQEHMHTLISDVQTGFQKNRQMAESYIYAQQILQHSKKNNVPLALLKLDIKKAFDTISWEFILRIMQQLGFPVQWIQWIHDAVLQGSSQVLINGQLGKQIILKCGVRQGDPISPQLFIIGIDYLARYLQKLENTGAIRLPYATMHPCLLYADNALLFMKLDPNQARAIKITLSVFQHVSGLAMNLDKSELLLTNVDGQTANELEQILGCKLKPFPFTYLGIPLSDKKLPRSAYLPLIEKMNVKLAGWAARFLSIAGRLVLLNSILSSMPMHYMSVIRLPEWVINEIDKIRRQFLWKGASEQGKGYHLVDWQTVCKPKDIGGLGILDMRIFNQSLLLKWIWWWHKNEQKIWKPIMQIEALDVNNIPTAPIFKQVNMEIVNFFNNSTIFIPGDGSRILVWEHNWGYGILKHRLQYVYSYALQPQLTLQQLATSQEITTNFRPNMSDEEHSELQIIMQWISN